VPTAAGTCDGAPVSIVTGPARAGGDDRRVLRRMLLIGDVHAEDEWLAAVLTHGAGQVDAVLSVGDIVDDFGGAGEVTRCIELLV
jgi:hypothetical protein